MKMGYYKARKGVFALSADERWELVFFPGMVILAMIVIAIWG